MRSAAHREPPEPATTGGSPPEIDLVYDTDCPHVEEARQLLRDALLATGLSPRWREWQRDAVDIPPSLRGLGSPTIVVNGKDVSTATPPTTDREVANSCRIYHDGRELRGVPSFDVVTRALASRRPGPTVTDPTSER